MGWQLGQLATPRASPERALNCSPYAQLLVLVKVCVEEAHATVRHVALHLQLSGANQESWGKVTQRLPES